MASARVVTLFVILLKTASDASASDPILTTVTSPDNDITLTIRCEVPQSFGGVQTIEVGKGTLPDPSHNPYGYSSYTTLASIGSNNQISNNLGQDIGVDGHMDPRDNASYLSVSMHNAGCTYDGQVYCKVTSNGGRITSLQANVTICSAPAAIFIKTPDVSKPLNVIVRCDVNTTNMTGSLVSVTMLKLSSSHSNASVVISGRSTDGKTSTFAQTVIIKGHINGTDPSLSFLEVEFTHGTCGDLGEFRCVVAYTTSHPAGSNTTSAVTTLAKTSTDNICDPNYLTATVTYASATARMTLTCYNNGYNSLTVVSREALLLSSGIEHQIFFVDSTSANSANVLNPNYTSRAVEVSSLNSNLLGQQQITLKDASCLDAGRNYRCKMVYISNLNALKVYIADATLPPCDTGALTSVNRRTLTCRPDPTIVTSGLISLEVSTITKARALTQGSGTGRTVVAYLNPFLNNGLPVDESGGQLGELHLTGHLDPSDPAASYLTLTDGSAAGPDLNVTTSCMVVYIDNGGNTKKAIADTIFQF